MRVSKVTLYCKLPTCPPSEQLLSLVRNALGVAATARVKAHLRTCDFCSAESQLLAIHSVEFENEGVATEMPGNLQLLAESILHPQNGASTALTSKRNGAVPVSFTKQ